MEANNNAKLREALRFLIENESTLFEADLSNGELELLHQIVDRARAALAAPARECDRFDDDLQADGLHEAFVKYCNDCDCPIGCIHRRKMEGLLDVRCASILNCFARFALSKASNETEVKDGSK